jgi:DNA gyrase B
MLMCYRDIAVGPSDGQFQQVSFVNAICTIKGGNHVNYIADQVVAHLTKVCVLLLLVSISISTALPLLCVFAAATYLHSYDLSVPLTLLLLLLQPLLQ